MPSEESGDGKNREECPDGEHAWEPTHPAFSDGWACKCEICGKYVRYDDD